MAMFNLNYLKKSGLYIYIIFYLIFPNLAIAQSKQVALGTKLENSLNLKDIKSIQNSFEGKESLSIPRKFSKILKEFTDLKWQIRSSEIISGENIFDIKVIGKKIVGGEIFLLESNFKYFFSTINNKINDGNIKNLLTTIRNDQNKIDITFRIPDKVLTGTKYDIDIILNEPLGEIIIAGGIKSHQDESFIKEEISIEPLSSGGIFKTTRAPASVGTQIWSGTIIHPEGIVSFTKSVEIVEQI